MTTYTYSQLESYWTQAGGAPALAPLMAAIALAESAGNPAATNPIDNNGTQTSWGLWQVSNGTHAQPAPDILDPLVNARQAVAKYQSQGLAAWGTYANGAYRQFLQGGTVTTPAAAPGAAPGSASASTAAPATTSSLGLGSVLSGASGLLKDVATVLDYTFGVFGRGQGWRIVFTVVTIVAVLGAYKSLAAAGAVPSGLLPSVVPVPV